MVRFTLLALLLASPALAQEADCGACTELDRAALAEPVPPTPLPAPPAARRLDRGKEIDVPVPGAGEVTVFHKPGAGLWVSDFAPGGVYVKPRQGKLSVDMRF